MAVALGSAAVLGGVAGPGEASTGQGPRFHPEAGHPWNRLHAAIARREVAAGQAIGLDEVDPLLWPSSSYLLEPERHAEVLAAIEAFVGAGEDAWIDDPLPRVLMQHDLWAVFDWAIAQEPEFDLMQLARWEAERRRMSGEEADPERVAAELGRQRDERRDRRRSLASALVPALARVAPTSEALAGLPDNLAAAERAWTGPREADPKQPQRPFLPLGLEDSNGAWLSLGELEGDRAPLAASHAAVFGGRSLFEVRLRIPAGREATLAWLAALREHPASVVDCEGGTCGIPLERPGLAHQHLNPDVPQPPPGSMVALVRRVIAFDDQSRLQATRLVKSVQIRVFLDPPDGAARLTLGQQPEGWPWQAVAEFVLDPARLLAGEAGGLVPIQSGQHAFTFLGSHGDQVEHLPQDLDPRRDRGHLDRCVSCHGTAGTLSLNSYTRIFTGPGTHLVIPVRRPPRLLDEIGSNENLVQALEFKRERFDWGALWAWLDPGRGGRPPGSQR